MHKYIYPVENPQRFLLILFFSILIEWLVRSDDDNVSTVCVTLVNELLFDSWWDVLLDLCKCLFFRRWFFSIRSFFRSEPSLLVRAICRIIDNRPSWWVFTSALAWIALDSSRSDELIQAVIAPNCDWIVNWFGFEVWEFEWIDWNNLFNNSEEIWTFNFGVLGFFCCDIRDLTNRRGNRIINTVDGVSNEWKSWPLHWIFLSWATLEVQMKWNEEKLFYKLTIVEGVYLNMK